MTGIPVFICLKTWVLVYAISEYFTLKANLNDWISVEFNVDTE